MVQGAKKLSRPGKLGKAGRAKSGGLRKGARYIKPKKKSARQAVVTKKMLTKAINKNIESELLSRAGGTRSFKYVKVVSSKEEAKDPKGKQKRGTGRIIKDTLSKK